MNRRSLFKRAAAMVVVTALAPVVKFLPKPPVTVATYDEILKRIYAPAIMQELQRKSLIFSEPKFGWVSNKGYKAVYTWYADLKEGVESDNHGEEI